MPEGLGHQSYRLWVPSPAEAPSCQCPGVCGAPVLPLPGDQCPRTAQPAQPASKQPRGSGSAGSPAGCRWHLPAGAGDSDSSSRVGTAGLAGSPQEHQGSSSGSIPAWSPALGRDSEVLEPLCPWGRQVCAPRLLTPLSAEPSPAPCDSSSFDKPWLSFGFNQNCCWHLCPAGWRGPRG